MSVLVSREECWLAVQCRVKTELRAALSLERKGYDVFSPTYRRTDGDHCVESPLFPGYLFCRFGINVSEKIVVTPGVIGVVKFGGAAVPVPEAEIEAIHRIITSGIARQPWHFLPVGCKVRIDGGPLAGITGILAAESKSQRLIVSIWLLRRSVAVAIDGGVPLTVLSAPSEGFPVPESRRRERSMAVAMLKD